MVHSLTDVVHKPPGPAVLERVSKHYGSVKALEDVSLEVAQGEVLALLGPNGAGKTTAVSLMLGLMRPGSGRVALFGQDPRSPRARQRAGAMLQLSGVPQTLRVRELVELFRSYYPAPLPLERVAEAAQLGGILHRLYGQLSGGQKQRVHFALAVCGDPDVLFLDEPTVGMDVESRRAFWAQVRSLARAGKTVLLTTHYLEEADALADRVVVLDQGRVIAEGTPAEIKARTAGRQIRAVTRLSPEAVRRLPGVTSVQAKGNALQVLAVRAEPVVAELLRLDPGLSDLEVTGAGLEEAFLALTTPATKEAVR
ncbi:Daunorubicin/doxorubicin resistance ATP-binding protein DrrA [Calidithermus terrae]|uniref:Daunorubicin/doxorubicin resistance ATP-binding protein DrrA n=1 Tax=Calidithermus terrae TaxID=1408545 RepID=A0A399E2R8_9DEIN|nr:ABC transporter ATP-binding protein [Calidithermus terrae]RIH76342.1 Daunorubicin/doxorubicin resistance ATP-binding protein DrrA [Calidithermus terrae]